MPVRRPVSAWWLLPPAFVLILLAGCQTRRSDGPLASNAPPPPVFAVAPAACDADAAAFALGQRFTPPLGESMRQRSRAGIVRTLQPGAAAAGDDRDAGRLTVVLDAQGQVAAARCG
ncbi:MAG: hypothetical protein EOO24_05275 [Comamonadaceae bacterium]|nr:MAG: hypothetical protein EOO24_05275 [Comamonadaceae bacterium]